MTKPPYSRYIRLRLPLLVVMLALGSMTGAFGATSIQQFGITWTFDRDYPSGQFANGDYWVVGPVKIVSISPRSVSNQNGSMVNPVVNGPQGYDSRIRQNKYDPATNVATKLPLTLPPGSSLLSSASYAAHATGDNPQLKTIAILTVLGAPAPGGSFRPPYIGSDKSLTWNKSQLKYDRLRSLPRVPHAPDPAKMAARFERPWIEQNTTWTGRYLHPRDNQPGYGRDISHVLAQGVLTLQLNYSDQKKEKLLIRLVQYGIDVFGAARAGAIWPAGGGHNHGRKMPMLLAGTVLGDNRILAYGDGRKLIFQEDRQTWYVSQSDVGRTLYTADGRSRLRYIQKDVGLAEWGEQHADAANRDGRNWNAPYRTVAGGSTIGHVLAARLMGLQEIWNWPAIFDYYDRYWTMEKDRAGRDTNAIPKFVAEMWKAYRHLDPSEFTEDNVATEVWQNVSIPVQNGSFTVAFDTVASASKINGVVGLSRGGATSDVDLIASLRYAPSGRFEALNGKTYQASKTLGYSPGVKYRVVATINVTAKNYSVTITPAGGKPVQIADRWKFRDQSIAAHEMNSLSFFSTGGYHAVLSALVNPTLSQLAAPSL